MSYEVHFCDSFWRSAKGLKKRFPSFVEDMKPAVGLLKKHPRIGDVIRGSKGLRKLRVANSDQDKGKRSGYRVIYKAVSEPESIIYFLFVYFKPDKANLTHTEVNHLIAELAWEQNRE